MLRLSAVAAALFATGCASGGSTGSSQPRFAISEDQAMAAAVEELLTRPAFPLVDATQFPDSVSFCLHIVDQLDESTPSAAFLRHFNLTVDLLPPASCPRAYKSEPPDSVWLPLDTGVSSARDRYHLYVSRPNVESVDFAWVVVRVYRGSLGLLNLCQLRRDAGVIAVGCSWVDVISGSRRPWGAA